MGIIKAAVSALGGGLSDQWLESWEADNLSDQTVMASGVPVRRNDKRNQNKKGTENLLTDGSLVHVGVGQCLLVVDGGKVVDFCAEPGYFEVRNQNAPSLFSGNLGTAVAETFNRVRFGGVTPFQQKAVFINTQEIKNIAFGTANPINYFDNFYNAELFLRAHGYFSIRITDPLKFYTEAVPHNLSRVEVADIQKLYVAEFLQALQTAVGQMSADGQRISHIPSKSTEVAKYLANALDDEWTQRRGMVVESVGLQSISYDEGSRKLIDMRNQGAMLGDPGVREGYVQGAVARGLESAGSNAGGAALGFMGVNMGMQSGGVAQFSQANQAQMQASQAAGAGSAQAGDGQPRFCSACGAKLTPGARFCASCGAKL